MKVVLRVDNIVIKMVKKINRDDAKNELKQNHRRVWKTNSRDSLKQECLVPHRKVVSYVVAPRNTFCVQSRWYYKVQFVQNSVWALLLPCGGRGRWDLLLAVCKGWSLTVSVPLPRNPVNY